MREITEDKYSNFEGCRRTTFLKHLNCISMKCILHKTLICTCIFMNLQSQNYLG